MRLACLRSIVAGDVYKRQACDLSEEDALALMDSSDGEQHEGVAEAEGAQEAKTEAPAKSEAAAGVEEAEAPEAPFAPPAEA